MDNIKNQHRISILSWQNLTFLKKNSFAYQNKSNLSWRTVITTDEQQTADA